MSSQGKESSGLIKAAFITGIFAVIAACVGGAFLIVNTFISNGFIVIGPSVQAGNPQSKPTSVSITSTPRPTLESSSTCSEAIELGPWQAIDEHGQDIYIDSENGFVHADLWRPGGPQLKAGYEDVSVIIEPGTKVTVINVAGQAWKYDAGCSRAYVEAQVERYNEEKRQGGWTITNVTLSELSTR